MQSALDGCPVSSSKHQVVQKVTGRSGILLPGIHLYGYFKKAGFFGALLT